MLIKIVYRNNTEITLVWSAALNIWEFYLYKFKGIVFSKNESSVINYSPSCCSKPVRPSFIFRTQFKIFLMKSKSFLTLHRQQCNLNVPRPRKVYDIIKMWHQWFNYNFTKLREYFLYKENKNNDFIQEFFFKKNLVFCHYQEYLCAEEWTRMLRGTLCNRGIRDPEEKNCWIKLLFLLSFCTKSILIAS